MAVSRFVSSRRDFDLAKVEADAAKDEFEKRQAARDDNMRQIATVTGESLAMDADVYRALVAGEEPESLARDLSHETSSGARRAFIARCERRVEAMRAAKPELDLIVKTASVLLNWDEVADRLPREAKAPDVFMWKYLYLDLYEQRLGKYGQATTAQTREIRFTRNTLGREVERQQEEQSRIAEKLVSDWNLSASVYLEAASRNSVAAAEFKRIKAGDDYALIVRVLGYATVLMVCYPLVLLALPLTEVPLLWRLCATIPFVAGLVVMSRFMAVYAAYLNGNVEQVPSGLLRLMGWPTPERSLAGIFVVVEPWRVRVRPWVKRRSRQALVASLLFGPVVWAVLMLSVFATYMAPTS